MHNPSDQMLLARVALRDREAFAMLYDRHAPRVFGLISKLVPARREAEDLLQDVFWQVWNRANQFDAARGMPADWLLLIARSRCRDHWRRAGRRPMITLPEDAQYGEDQSSDHPGDVERQEFAHLARRAMDELPSEQRHCIQLAFWQGLTHQEIASSQGLPLGTVKTRIRLGMRKLRDILVRPEDRSYERDQVV